MYGSAAPGMRPTPVRRGDGRCRAGKEHWMKRHRAASAATAVVAGVIAAGALATGAQAWGEMCPPGVHDSEYCEHHHHHHHRHAIQWYWDQRNGDHWTLDARRN
jgi:hypothetical protein